MTQVLKILETQ